MSNRDWEKHANTLLLGVLLVSNTLLVFLVLVKLRKTPTDVFNRLQQTELEVGVEIDRLQRRQEEVREVLDGRGEWMRELQQTLENASKSRWHHYDAKEAWSQYFKANPQAVKPEKFLPDIVEPNVAKYPEAPK